MKSNNRPRRNSIEAAAPKGVAAFFVTSKNEWKYHFVTQRRSVNTLPSPLVCRWQGIHLNSSSVLRQQYRGETEGHSPRGEGLKAPCIWEHLNPSVLRTPPLYFASQNTEEEFKCNFVSGGLKKREATLVQLVRFCVLCSRFCGASPKNGARRRIQ